MAESVRTAVDDRAVDSWTRYLNEIGRVPLLDPPEVTELAHAIEVGVLALARLADEPDADVAADLRHLAAAGERARQHLVSANLRLVVSVAKRASGRGVPLADLVQEGSLGLIRAVEKFDHRLGFAFSTYARWWIRQSINRAVAEQSRVVRVPVHVHDGVVACARERDRIGDATGRVASMTEVAEATGLGERRTAMLLRAAAPAVPLHQVVPGVGSAGMVGLDGSDPADLLATDHLHERLEVAMRHLPDEHRRVLAARVGWPAGDPLSQRAVSAAFGISRDVVRRVEAQAHQMLRDMPQVTDLASWLDD